MNKLLYINTFFYGFWLAMFLFYEDRRVSGVVGLVFVVLSLVSLLILNKNKTGRGFKKSQPNDS